jgi:NAD(P)H dehydrogenase (quinone)
VISGVRYYIDDHKRGAFEFGAPTSDVLDVTGRPAEDFDTIARRYAALPGNRCTLGNRLRHAQFMLTPLSPAFDLDRCDRELRWPFP